MTTDTPRRRPTFNTRRRIVSAGLIVLLIVAVASVAYWGTGASSPDELSGNVMLWHSLSGRAAETLDDILTEFEKLNPHAAVYQQPFASQEALLEQYEDAVASGLGPDLILGDAAWVTTLAESGNIRLIDGEIDTALVEQYLPVAIDTLTYGDQLFGLPLSLRVPALYYNSSLVETPPQTLDALLTQAAAGHTVLMSTDFRDALWGIQAFGGTFFDDENRAILDQGGYANWLDWLLTARTAPGMILDANRQALQEAFLQGDASYYVGYPEELELLVQGLGQDNLGVAPLPTGPTGSAGPVLGVDALMFSPVSSQHQQAISLELAKFITNAEQSATFMRQAGKIPANSRVRINPRLHPLLAAFSTQARSAISLPNLDTSDAMWAAATNAYNRAISGLSTPLETAAETTSALNQLNGIAAGNGAGALCTDIATLRLAHNWEGADAGVLEEIVRRYKTVCPLVIVHLEQGDLDTVRANWKSNPGAATNPDIVLASQEWLIEALEDGIAFRDLSTNVPTESLQRYLPAALAGMRDGLRLLGLPMSVRAHVLYYNKTLVNDPAPILDRLRLQAASGVPITLEARFAPAFWGIGAFGGQLLDSEGRPALDEGAMSRWLAWLRQSRDEYGIKFAYDALDAKSALLDGSSAYFAGEPIERADLVEGLGVDNLGIALLPAGPEGDATPLFLASGLFFNDRIADRDLAAALNFALFATDAQNQRLLVERTQHVPANTTVDLTDQPHVVTVLEQARTAYPIPNHPQIRAVLQLGDHAYTDVLVDGMDPDAAVAGLMNEINALLGYQTDDGADGAAPPVDDPSPAATQSTPTTVEPATGAPAEPEAGQADAEPDPAQEEQQ